MVRSPVMADDSRLLSIAGVERETGLGKDVLRVWEKRYGFPAPERDVHGDRVYPMDQVDKLRLLRRLIDDGLRPGKIVGLPISELLSLHERATRNASPAHGCTEPELQEFIELLSSHRIDEFRLALLARLMRLGLERFVLDIAAPLCTLVGDAWARGTIQLFEEHMFTEELTRVLRGTLQSLARPSGDSARPRVLLTTVSGEPHAIGLLMAETLMSLNSCDCLSLGPQTPEGDIAQAAIARQADIVILSFSAWFNAQQVGAVLTRLRSLLPAQCEIWAGGRNPGLQRDQPSGVTIMTELREISAAITAWRRRHDR